MGKIITIGREFGSGGREVGKRLSDELGIAYYDNEIITEIAKRTELAEGYVQHVMENGPTALMPITIGRTFYMGADPVMEQNNAIYREQSLLVQELAEKSDCVIVGRSADYILRDKKPLRLFIYADMESRMERCRKRAPEQEHFLAEHKDKMNANVWYGIGNIGELEKKRGIRNVFRSFVRREKLKSEIAKYQVKNEA